MGAPPSTDYVEFSATLAVAPAEKMLPWPGRCRSDNSDIKAVFKLQFHATEVPSMCVLLDRPSGCSAEGFTVVEFDGLMVSLVLGDIRKPTVRSEKAVIRDGGCKWDSPVYETVNFNRDRKTGNIHETKYHFILSMESGNSDFVEEASVNFCGLCQSNQGSLSSPAYKETHLLELKILDLDSEVEIYRRDKDEPEIQMEALAIDYEILKCKHCEVSYKWEQL